MKKILPTDEGMIDEPPMASHIDHSSGNGGSSNGGSSNSSISSNSNNNSSSNGSVCDRERDGLIPSKPSTTADLAWIDTESRAFRMALLSILSLQTSTAVVLARYTRSAVPRDEMYDSNHLVLIIEAVKLIVSCCLDSYTSVITGGGGLLDSIRRHVLSRPLDALKLAIPAVIYLFQNTLLYVAFTHLPAPLFLSAYQGKIVSTAIVSVLMLGRRYSTRQWMCLLALTAGVTVVILDEQNRNSSESTTSDDSGGVDNEKESSPFQEQSIFLGIAAIAGCCISSAFAGVYIELVMKKDSGGVEAGGGSSGIERASTPSLWIRNIQMAFFSLLAGVARLAWEHLRSREPSQKSLLHGFGTAVWLLVFVQVLGGILVAAAMKYADNVLKSLSAAVAVLLVSISSVLWLHTEVSGVFVVGATAVVASVYLFSNPLPLLCWQTFTSTASPSAPSTSSPCSSLESNTKKRRVFLKRALSSVLLIFTVTLLTDLHVSLMRIKDEVLAINFQSAKTSFSSLP